MNKKEIISLLNKIKKVTKENDPSKKLPNNCYYLDDDFVYVGKNNMGDSRHPYSIDGLTLWAYGSGYITLNESDFFFIPPTNEGKESFLSFYLGIKNKKNLYDYYSLSGVNDTYLGIHEENFVVFSSVAAYYIRKINGILTVLKTTVTKDKKVIFSLYAENQSNKEKEVYLSSYQNYFAMHSAFEHEEMKWFRSARLTDYGALIRGLEDVGRTEHFTNYILIKRTANSDNIETTTSNIGYRGNKNGQLCNSIPLLNGKLLNNNKTTGFSESSCYGDIIKKTLNKGETLEVSYLIDYAFNDQALKEKENITYTLNDNDLYFDELKKSKSYLLKNKFKVNFGQFNDINLDNNLFNNFFSNVVKQVDYCALSKNSTLRMLGVRDVFQMLEAEVLWNPKKAREVIVQTLNFIAPNGRAPRQYSLPNKNGVMALDTREFIDQVQWIITTLYTYLTFTSDYSILKEKCGFIEINQGSGKVLNLKSTVEDHLKKMINYLVEHIDENTGCLRTLFGDWNDAVNGLGLSSDPTKEFGNGVSVMASEHLYKNLKECIEIFSLNKDEKQFVNDLELVREKLGKSILNHAVITKGGTTKIVHGWGENQSFYVGSFSDVDNRDRYSSTSYSFYVINVLNKEIKDLKVSILNAYDHLDSKYGYKTFDIPFYKEDGWKVGRIINLPEGTAENAATYIHAGLFAVRSLFLLNESSLAMKQLYKLLPITHSSISTSPFIMPNSYGYNEELGVDGESMNDWYTGSSNTLIKAIVFDCFGITPLMGNSVIVKPVCNFPSNSASINIMIKNKLFYISYKKQNNSRRRYLINGIETDNELINLDNYKDSKVINLEVID